jgi:hypothetical protein
LCLGGQVSEPLETRTHQALGQIESAAETDLGECALG